MSKAPISSGLAQFVTATTGRNMTRAAELAGAARRAAARLVEINLSARPEDPRLAEARQLGA